MRDAVAYVAWLSKKTSKAYRLPNEAEWEYAARAITSAAMPHRARYWGDERGPACRYANVYDASWARPSLNVQNSEASFACNDKFAFTAPVGSFKPNAFGLYDMLGNVSQWTGDCWHDDYQAYSPEGEIAWILPGNCTRRGVRGGSWWGDPGDVRAGKRVQLIPVLREANVGFRVARSY